MNMKTADIKIPKSFQRTTPKPQKMKECRDFWKKYHTQDRYIVIDRQGFLKDGYIQYLVLKEFGINSAEVKVSNRPKRKGERKRHYDYGLTTYVYGKHWRQRTQKYSKEYVWRMSKAWIGKGLAKDVKPGDKVLVSTNMGVKPVVVTRVETTNENPVFTKVKKVICKLPNKN